MSVRGLLRAARMVLLVVTGLWVVRLATRHTHPAAPAPITPVMEPPPIPEPEPEPEPVVAAPPPPLPVRRPAEPAPEREPFWADLGYPLGISLAIILIAGMIWYAEFRPRAEANDVQQHVALSHPGSTIGCASQAANGSKWACAVVYEAESACISVAVSPLGRVSGGRETNDRCTAPALTAMLPETIDRTAVAADVTRIVGGSGAFVCAKVRGNSSRWACARSAGTGSDCRSVRIVPWTPLKPKADPKLCKTIPTLRATVTG